ncbi:MAG: glycosyl transferase, partial [Candidatus Binatia bacterium]
MKYLLSRLRPRLSSGSPTPPQDLIRSELFSIERLEQHAESLAAAQGVTRRPGAGRELVSRLGDNGRVLLAVYRDIGKAIREERAITPAAEWLVDNFHIVEEQIREIRDDLPRGYYRQLPKLETGPLEGYPRVFGLAWAYVAHTDSHFEPETLVRFVRAYQRIQPLTIGELWAVAITLRIVLVENLRRASDLIESSRAERQQADALADRLLGTHGEEAESLDLVLRSLEPAPLPRAMAVQLVQRLRDQDPAVTPALHWLDERLAAQATTAEEVVGEEHQRQGAMNVTVRNVITSMRLMSAVDWAEFFESVSLVDAVLRTDAHFGAMDFATRDRYRHAIEELARGSGRNEGEVAAKALHAARQAKPRTPPGGQGPSDGREQDPGYYLISKGRPALESEIGFRISPKIRLGRVRPDTKVVAYIAAISVVTALVLAWALLLLARAGIPAPNLAVLAVLALAVASDAAVALVNHMVTHRLGAKILPGLELRDGVPKELRTIVVVPTLLTSAAEIEEQVERLEVRHLANAEGDIRFALLSDWTDAATETTARDEELLATAVAAIDRLNRRHEPAPDGERFLLLHRRRVW